MLMGAFTWDEETEHLQDELKRSGFSVINPLRKSYAVWHKVQQVLPLPYVHIMFDKLDGSCVAGLLADIRPILAVLFIPVWALILVCLLTGLLVQPLADAACLDEQVRFDESRVACQRLR